MDAMHGMLKQEGGVNKANLMGSEPKLTSSAPLEKGEDSDEPVWLVLTRALSAGSCFIDRPYCAASPQASHRACPALRSEEHTSELQSRLHLVCRLLLEKKKTKPHTIHHVHQRLTTTLRDESASLPARHAATSA